MLLVRTYPPAGGCAGSPTSEVTVAPPRPLAPGCCAPSRAPRWTTAGAPAPPGQRTPTTLGPPAASGRPASTLCPPATNMPCSVQTWWCRGRVLAGPPRQWACPWRTARDWRFAAQQPCFEGKKKLWRQRCTGGVTCNTPLLATNVRRLFAHHRAPFLTQTHCELEFDEKGDAEGGEHAAKQRGQGGLWKQQN